MPFLVMDDIILKYFNNGFSYLEIVEFLNHVHDFQISLSILKSWLKDNNLKRRPLAAGHSSNEIIRQLFIYTLFYVDIYNKSIKI